MQCKVCGRGLGQNEKFCSYFGAQVGEAPMLSGFHWEAGDYLGEGREVLAACFKEGELEFHQVVAPADLDRPLRNFIRRLGGTGCWCRSCRVSLWRSRWRLRVPLGRLTTCFAR